MEVGSHMSVEESEMITQLLGAQCFEDYNHDFNSCFSSSYYSSNWPQEGTCIGLNWEGYNGYCNLGASTNSEDIINPKPTKRKCEIESNLDSCIQVPKKKALTSTTNASEENEGMNEEKNHDDSSSCLSENDSTDKSKASNSTGKYTKSSLYARKRRERINQRLRTLQKLIPNGTKVDISTMLEEAYQYVKFLQHQIKILSSNELWMYAPIAFNGMDEEINLDISQAQQSAVKLA
ncbi:Transcription factor bHLH84 [Carex littledalei]|uniref:Transcription factor bHLH84 n=1 Tax=Carex littledalei TaxID=544730 RepID=A0A833RFB8_9POAL|nr:Transcription factor bHLH84 [Carex littledalei]